MSDVPHVRDSVPERARGRRDRDAERNNDINLEKKTLLEFTWTHLTKDQDYIRRTVRRLLAS